MHISLRVKLFLMFLMILGTCFVPGYVLLRVSHQRTVREMEQRLAQQTIIGTHRLAKWPLASIPKEQYESELKNISELTSAHATLLLTPPSGESAKGLEEEMQEAEKNQNHYGAAIRLSDKQEYHLFVAKAFYDAQGKLAILRYDLSIDASIRSFQRTEWGLIASCAAAAIFSLFFLGGFIHYFLRPLNRIKQIILAFSEGEYHYPSLKGSADEIEELQKHLFRFARHLQEESLRIGLDQAAWDELVRVLPTPTAILRSNFGLLHLNALFRDEAEINPATEHARFHELSHSAAFLHATAIAKEKRQTSDFSLRLSWLTRPLKFVLAPLPQAHGQVAWALFIESEKIIASAHVSESLHVLRESLDILEKIVQRDPSEYLHSTDWLRARFTEMRVWSDLSRALQEPVLSTEIFPTSVDVLLEYVRSEMDPVLKERNIPCEWVSSVEKIQIAEQEKSAERVLRAALLRVIHAFPIKNFKQRTEDMFSQKLKISVEQTGKWVIFCMSGFPAAVAHEDLDRLLHNLGGLVRTTPLQGDASMHETDSTESPEGKGPHALWLYLRRA